MARSRTLRKGAAAAVTPPARKLTVVIPAAGLGRRMKSYGPKALIEVAGRQTLIGRQLSILRSLFPAAAVVVVVGFEAERVARALPPNVRVVENEGFCDSNVCRSLFMGMRSSGETDSVLVVYGDLVFNARTLEGLPTDRSTAIVDTRGRFGEFEVGCTVAGGKVVNFSYGLPTKWAQIVLLTGHELATFRRLACSRERRRHFGFEVLNDVLEQGGTIEAREPAGMQVVEVDSSKDIRAALSVGD